jgi:hypothetical protein
MRAFVKRVIGLVACALALPAVADNYYWRGGATARNWDLAYWTNSVGGGALTNAPYANAGDTGTATNGQINVVANTTFAGQLNIGAGNTLYLGDGTGTGNSIHFTGGVFFVEGYGASDLRGAISVDANSYLDCDSRGGDKKISAPISGSANLVRRSGGTTLKIVGTNSSYGGNWIVSGGSLQFGGNAAAGNGSVSVESGGTLVFATGVAVTNPLTFKAGSTGDIPNYCYSPTGTAMRLAGGKIRHQGSIVTETLYGMLEVTSDSILDAPGSYWVVNATMSGTGRVEKTGIDALYINADNSAFAGGWLTSAGTLEFQQTGAWGGGALAVNNYATNRLGVNVDLTITNALAGSGYIEVGQNSGSGASRKLTLSGATLRPGSAGAGILTLRNGRTPYTTYRCDVALATNGTQYGRFEVDVTGAGNTAGTDYDQVRITAGTLTGLSNADLAISVAPSLNAVSAGMQGKALVVLTNQSGLVSNAPFHSVTFTPGWTGALAYQTNAVVVTLASVVSLTNAGVNNIGVTSATGYVTLSGTNADLSLFWDTADRGQTNTAWANTNFIGAGQAPGAIAGAAISNLVAGQTYVARFFGVDTLSGSTGWSLPVVFSPVSGASVDNAGGAISVTATGATLRGTVLAGSPDPAVWIYWGTTNGLTNKASWNLPTFSIGTPGLVAFATNTPVLLASQQYWYRCYASNVNGDAWAPASTNFTTLAPVLSINTNVTVLEGSQGTTTSAVFTLTLSAASALPVSVDYATSNGTATVADNDYAAASGTLIIPAGNLTTQIVVTVNGDNRIELDETCFVNLTNAAATFLSTNRASVQIVNDDFNCYVRGDGAGSDGNDGGTWTTAYATLQKALDSCIPGVSNNIYIQASSGSQVYDVASRTVWTSGTYTLAFLGGWNDVGGTAVQTGFCRVQDTNGPVDQCGINVVCENAHIFYKHTVTVDRFIFSNVVEGIHLEDLGGDGHSKDLTVRNTRIYAQGRGVVVSRPHNYESTFGGPNAAKVSAENVNIVAGLGGGGGQTNHGIYAYGAWTGSRVTASGTNAATGEPNVSTITSADGCGIYMLATSLSAVETDVATFSNLVVHGCSSNGLYLSADLGNNPDRVQATLNHCTIAGNGRDGVLLLSTNAPNALTITNSIVAGNNGHGVNAGAAGWPAFPCTENYNVFFDDDITTNGVAAAAFGANTVTTDPQFWARQAKPDPWYKLSSRASPAFQSGSDGASRGAYQALRLAGGTTLIFR